MDSRETGNGPPPAGTPEDVAALYSWANLHGAKYRDFSASRREYRAQVRYRAAQALRERELQAQGAAEAAAEAAERAAEAAEAAVSSASTSDSQALRLHTTRTVEAAKRKAAAERVEASRRAAAAAQAGAVAQREEREIAEAHASAQRQALSYAESEARRLQLAGPQPRGPLPGEICDPFMPLYEGHRSGNASGSTLNLSQEPAPWRRPRSYRLEEDPEGFNAHGSVFGMAVSDTSEPSTHPVRSNGLGPAPAFNPEGPLDPEPDWVTVGRALQGTAVEDRSIAEDAVMDRAGSRTEAARNADSRSEADAGSHPRSISDFQSNFDFDFDFDSSAERPGPAWLYASQIPSPVRVTEPIPQALGRDTLQDSRERMAARRFALKGAFEHAGPELPTMQLRRPEEARAPLLLVFSLAGGVGNTSLAATLGRALSSQGEKVVLADTTSHGMLPFYFGARELRQGAMRTFSPPAGSNGEPIYLVSYEVGGIANDERQQEILTGEILGNMQGNNRIVLDISAAASWLLRRVIDLHPTVLVPVAPDMNSVVSLQVVERFFQGMADADGCPLLPFYVLNQFDATLPLHLDVREVFRRQLGDRLLNFVIRRSQAVSEALAEGMTVVDYAPEAPVSKDYFHIAAWLQTVSPPAAADRSLRWSGLQSSGQQWSRQ